MLQNQQNNEKRHKLIREGAQYLTLGTEIFLPILAGALTGYYLLDQKLGTKPLWTVILTLTGFVVGMYTLYKTVMKVKKN